MTATLEIDAPVEVPTVTSQSRRSPDTSLWALRLGVIAGCLGAWEILARTEVLDPSAIPPMSTVVKTMVTQLKEPTFWSAGGQTISGVVAALAITVILAIPLGLIIGRFRVVQGSTRLLVDFCQTIPAVALIPLLVLVFGSTYKMKVILAVVAAIWPMLIQTAYGVRDVDSVAADTMRAFHIDGFRRIKALVIPTALPYVMTGLRICAVLCLMMITSGELLGDAPGLGHQMALAQSTGAIASMWAYVIVIGLLGVALNATLQAAEGRLLKWHPSFRPGVDSK